MRRFIKGVVMKKIVLIFALTCGAVIADVQPAAQQNSDDVRKARLADARVKLGLAMQAYKMAQTNADTPQEKLDELKAAVDAAEQRVDDAK